MRQLEGIALPLTRAVGQTYARYGIGVPPNRATLIPVAATLRRGLSCSA